MNKVIVVLAATATGSAIVVSAIHLGLRSLHGFRLAAFLCGAAALTVAGLLIYRGLRRRARLEAIADLLPRYRYRARLEDESMFEEPDLDGEFSERAPAARAEMRAATRALLVSLEDEMRRELGHARRAGRPACRRARLRMVNRALPRYRRRAAARPPTIFS